MSKRSAEHMSQEGRGAPSAQPPVAFVELITTAALALSTAVAVTAVSIGIARADGLVTGANCNGTAFALTALLALILPAVGAAIVASGKAAQHSS